MSRHGNASPSLSANDLSDLLTQPTPLPTTPNSKSHVDGQAPSSPNPENQNGTTSSPAILPTTPKLKSNVDGGTASAPNSASNSGVDAPFSGATTDNSPVQPLPNNLVSSPFDDKNQPRRPNSSSPSPQSQLSDGDSPDTVLESMFPGHGLPEIGKPSLLTHHFFQFYLHSCFFPDFVVSQHLGAH